MKGTKANQSLNNDDFGRSSNVDVNSDTSFGNNKDCQEEDPCVTVQEAANGTSERAERIWYVSTCLVIILDTKKILFLDTKRILRQPRRRKCQQEMMKRNET